jgi:selenocysteine lyase/cysteine desulfurase
MILSNQKELFQIPNEVTFLNCANMSPLLKSVNEAGVGSINKRNQPWTINNNDWFGAPDHLRELFGSLINSDKEHIALIPSVSYGMAIAAKNINLSAGQTIVLLDRQFPSNVYAWRDLSRRTGAKIITVKKSDDQSWTEAILENINEATGLVAIPNCHWTDGSLIDLEIVSAAARKVNAKLVIDASQSLGAYPLDIKKVQPDFLLTVGYKWLLGPFSIAFLYASDEYCEIGIPLEFANLNMAGSEDFSRLAYYDEYKSGARRFDAGESSSFIHVAMAIAGMTQVLKWGVANIQETLSALTESLSQKAVAAGLETTVQPRVGHIIGIKVSEEKVVALSKKLFDSHVYISFRGTDMRIAPHLYNDEHDIDKLFSCL